MNRIRLGNDVVCRAKTYSLLYNTIYLLVHVHQYMYAVYGLNGFSAVHAYVETKKVHPFETDICNPSELPDTSWVFLLHLLKITKFSIKTPKLFFVWRLLKTAHFRPSFSRVTRI